jgi:hypothetical protein
MASAASFEVLTDLVDADLNCDGATSTGLTNHLPMALFAKSELGAPPEELLRFAKRYQSRLQAIGVANRDVTRATWERAIGVPEAYPDLVRFFDDEIDALGVDVALRTYLPRLVSGLSGAAFHGVIRLSYALDLASPARVGAAMAYFAANAMPLAPLKDASDATDDPNEILRRLSSRGEGMEVPALKMISDEMRWVAQQPEFSNIASSLAVGEDTPHRLAETALTLYASTDDFTALHGVTGMEALSRIRTYLDDSVSFDRFSFQALAAAYVSIGAPSPWTDDRLSEFAVSTSLDHETVLQRAAESDDEHVAKIVFTTNRLAQTSARPLYDAVAERAVANDSSRPEHTTTLAAN